MLKLIRKFSFTSWKLNLRQIKLKYNIVKMLCLGDYCKPCNCNGNADPSAPRLCDPLTGEFIL